MSKKLGLKKIELKLRPQEKKILTEKIYSPGSKSPKRVGIKYQIVNRLPASNFLKRRDKKIIKSNEPSLLPTQNSATPKGLENKRTRTLSLSSNPIKKLEPGHLRKFSVQNTQNYVGKYFTVTQTGYIPDYPQKENQDSYCEIIEKDFSLFGVFDGHGVNGGQISNYLKTRIPLLLTKCSKDLSYGVKTCIKIANEEIVESFDSNFSGSTLNMVAIRGKKLFCANVGDSRAIIGNQINDVKMKASSGRNWVAIALSRDHKPDLTEEYERIAACGGRVLAYSDEKGNPTGPARVWLKDQNIPGLAMSRSIGDNVATSVGVIPDAEVLEYDLTPQDKFLLLGSDGVFEFLSNEDIVKIIVPYWKTGNINGACKAVVNAAEYQWKNVNTI